MSQIIKIIKSFIYVLQSEGIIVEKAFLFGSYQSGTATNESDIDVMIVTENGIDDYLTGRIWNLTRKIKAGYWLIN